MSAKRVFVFRQKGLFSPFWTFVWILITIYFLWRIGQMIAGVLPWWLIPVPILGIVYMWTMRLKAVWAVTVEKDGNVIFQRHWGRREVNAIYIKHVRRWFELIPSGFLLRHADGYELMFEDREQTVAVVRELLKHNPEIEVRGVPLPPTGAAKHAA